MNSESTPATHTDVVEANEGCYQLVLFGTMITRLVSSPAVAASIETIDGLVWRGAYHRVRNPAGAENTKLAYLLMIVQILLNYYHFSIYSRDQVDIMMLGHQ